MSCVGITTGDIVSDAVAVVDDENNNNKNVDNDVDDERRSKAKVAAV